MSKGIDVDRTRWQQTASGYNESMVASNRSDLLSRITIEDGKCGGRPCIRGQRIRVSDVLDLFAAGAAAEEILTDYPSLEREDLLAVFEYAARQTDHQVLMNA